MIAIKDLKKSYNSHEALKGISFNIKEGEFYGLLGPNGAGKTTTISIMSSILTPDSGEVLINGNNIYTHPNESKRIIGVVPQEIALYNELTAEENLWFWGGLYDVPKTELKKRIDEVLTLFGLSERRKDKVSTYSGGMKRRINIAAALLHQPRIVFMDEPTVGIDPQSRNLIFEVIEKLHSNGMTIVYTTHYMEEAERFCDRIGIIDNGQIIAEGTLDELRKSSSAKETIVITFNNLNDDKVQKIQSFWKDCNHTDDKIYFYTSDLKTELSKIISQCSDAGADIHNIEIKKVNLETVFLSLTGKQLRD
ncbi:MAG: ABC transporter [Bacteroidetes bacterium OLB10]|nr:MAG: ABC transporter [Bacteroidetes bacterium OLB10]MBX3105096.1 ABC transporter ATP-binding protein [Bacteroidota bacterium]MCB8929974.1 ABC transporter ATP-binding protein [Bacteroidia bacterium]MCW5930802.1 ABC transporter ATP-binding protein [Bacteroidota bacterium]